MIEFSFRIFIHKYAFKKIDNTYQVIRALYSWSLGLTSGLKSLESVE